MTEAVAQHLCIIAERGALNHSDVYLNTSNKCALTRKDFFPVNTSNFHSSRRKF